MRQILTQIYRCKKYLATALSLALLSVASCSDSGCIEADDFGEYETQTLEIVANSNSDLCFYDASKSMTDASQGSGLKECFITGDVEIHDESGAVQVSSSGCKGLPGAKFRNLCAMQCVSDCNASISADASGGAEPNWKSTSPKETGINGGVTLRPNSEISIRAKGGVQLGNSFNYPSIYVRANNFSMQSGDKQWAPSFFDFDAGKTLSLSFSGQFNDGSKPNGASVPIGLVGSGKSSVIDNKVYNAAKRLVVYMVDHPAGYEFDKSQTSEQAGSINIPLLPDANMWQCDYTGPEPTQSVCVNKSYRNNGYYRVSDDIVNKTFPITSQEKSAILGEYGGMIRWADDGLKNDLEDPFAGVDCKSIDCSNISVEFGKILGDYSADAAFQSQKASKISFRYALAASDCNNSIDISILSGASEIAKHSIDVSNAGYSTEHHISLERGQSLVVRGNPDSFVNSKGQTLSCGRALAVKATPYHDIEIKKSGLVSFAVLGGATESACIIDARIINPRGSQIDRNPSYTADYYEYSDFSTPGDPLRDFSVPILTHAQIWDRGGVNKGSKKVFVRKGQIIRFSPESWNVNWSSQGGARECGVGMAMRIEPRPALLCRGYGDDKVSNPTCVRKYTQNGFVGCDERAPECFDPSHGAYCPEVKCHRTVTCTDGSAPDYVRKNCVLGQLSNDCQYDKSIPPSYTAATCSACSNLRLFKAQQSPFAQQPNVSKCYDLENYEGKVDNIPITGFQAADLSNPAIAKGAKKLAPFDGSYGNMSNFKASGKKDKDTQNTAFSLDKIANVSRSGRMKIILLDGDDFLNINSFYSDNTQPGASYSGANGFKIGLTANLDFFNGGWLEAILCAESAEDSVDCKKNTTPIQISGQPQLVRYSPPTPEKIDPESITAFKFDPFGNITRTKPSVPGSGECLNALVGDQYYCHTDTTTPTENIRLSFKIRDPEDANCYITNPSGVKVAGGPDYDGIMMTNSKYRQNDCDIGNPQLLSPFLKNGISQLDAGGNRTCVINPNSGKTCAVAEAGCVKEFICSNKYSNNSGKYHVAVRVKNPSSGISHIVDDVISPVIEVMDGKEDGSTIGQAERIYTLIVNDSRYRAILSMCLIVMFTFYGFTYLMGISDASLSDIVSKVIKISIIYLFIGPTGWEWFNKIVVQFFKNGTDYLSFLMASSFDNSPELQTAIDNYSFYDKSILFKSVDNVFSLLFSSTVQKKISALLFASLFGWIYLIIIYYAIFAYIYAVSTAVLLYLTAQVFISVLFVLGPLFFLFTLFGQTKEMFDKWLQQLIGFSLQQIFLLVTLAFFNMMMYEVIKMSLGYKVCWEEVWTINIITRISLMSFWTIPSLPPSIDSAIEAGNVGKNDGIPSFFSILFMWVIAKLMHEFITFMTNVAADIGGGMSASSLSSGIAGAVGEVRKTAGKYASKAWDKSGGQAVRVVDKKLFDSGAEAKRQRQQKRQENSKKQEQKSALAKAGKKGIKEYKRKNGAELAGMSKRDQEEALRKVRDDSMIKKGKELGLSKDDVERLKKDKGLKYVDHNIIGAAGKAAYQSLRSGGSLTKGLEKKKIETDFSKKDAKKALKNADSEGREKFIKSVKDGDLKVNAGRIRKREMNLGIKSGLKSAKDKLVNSKERSEAIKQLTAEGEISKMRGPTGWARNDIEKKKIRDRIKKNASEKETGLKNTSRTSTIASLENEKKFLEENSARTGLSRIKGKLSHQLGGNAKRRREMEKEIKSERLDTIKEKFEEDHKQASKDFDKSNEAVEAANNKINGNAGYNQALNKRDDLQARMDKGDFKNEDEREALEKDLEGANFAVTQHENDMKDIFAERNSAIAERTNASKRKEKASKSINTIERAKVISSNPMLGSKGERSSKAYDKVISAKFNDKSIDKLKELNAEYGEKDDFRVKEVEDSNNKDDDDKK